MVGVGRERQLHAVETREHPNSFSPLGALSQFNLALPCKLGGLVGVASPNILKSLFTGGADVACGGSQLKVV